MRRAIAGMVIVASALLLLSSTVTAQRTLTVPGEYPTIQAAIDAAEPGDTVFVTAGTYVETLVIEESLFIVGEDSARTVLHPEDAHDVIHIALVDGLVGIAGMAVRGGSCGIRVSLGEAAQVDLHDLIVLGSQIGVAASGDGALRIMGSYFVENAIVGLALGNAVAVATSNEVLYGGTAVLLIGSVTATLDANLIGYSEWGIETYTTDCYGPRGTTSFLGAVQGTSNRVTPVSGTCPAYPGAPWPEGFLDSGWMDVVQEAGSANNLGVDLHRAHDLEGALRELERGLRLLDGSPFPLLQAYFKHDIGDVYLALGLYSQAMEEYGAAVGVYQARMMIDEVLTVCRNMSIIGDTLAERGHREEAIKTYESALEFAERYGMKTEEAQLLIRITGNLMELSRYEEALPRCHKALGLYEALHNTTAAAGVRVIVGVVNLHLGRYEEALKHFEVALYAFAALDSDVGEASAHGNLGITYRHLGLYDKALEHHRAALALYNGCIEDYEVGRTYLNLGVVYDVQGLHNEALDAYESARAVFAQLDDVDLDLANVDTNIGVVYGELGLLERSLAAFDSAREVYVRFGAHSRIAGIDQNVGRVLLALGLYEEALAALASALAILDSPELTSRDLYYAQRWVIHFNTGVAHERLGELDDALLAYEMAVHVVESTRKHLRTEELKLAWGDQTRHIYERLIDLLHRMGQGPQAFLYAERSRARTFLDILYGGGVQPEQLISAEAGISAGVVSPEAIDAAVDEAMVYLAPNEAVLSYFTTERGVYLWVIAWNEEEGAHVVSEPLLREYPRTNLLRDVVEGRKLLETPSPTTAQKLRLGELLKGLYDALVLPGLARLPEGVDTLVLVPSGPLWYVPFAALLMTDQPSIPLDEWMTRQPYLVEHYTVAYLPSVASLPSLLERSEVGEGVYLGLADPELTEDQLERLGMTEAQSRYTVLQDAAIAFALCQGGDSEPVYVGGAATEGRAHQEAPGHRVVVYAAHGQFNPYVPLQSELYLAPESGATPAGERRIADGAYRAWEILLTDHRGTELVVLAACESLLPALRNLQGQLGVLSGKAPDEIELTPEQLEQITTGDEVVGLARAFLSSGAQSVLGTLWQANPGAIKDLLGALCAQRQAGLSWAQALRQAQIELIAHLTFSHPWFWAPFQLIGGWR